MKRMVWRRGVSPQLTACARVDRPDVIGDREVEYAVHQDWSCLDALHLLRLVRPGKGHVGDIVWIDFGQRAVALTGVITMERRPAILRWLLQHDRIHILRLHAWDDSSNARRQP